MTPTAHSASPATAGRNARRAARRTARCAARRGFTLIEILVVMGIIVLLIALALPAFSFITGSRSTEAASNQVAAALGVARAQALGVQDVRGVAIYHDQTTDRTVATIVELRNPPFDDWVAGTPAAPKTYTFGQYVQTTTGAPHYYVCLESHTDTAGLYPLTNTQYWREMLSCFASTDTTLNTPIVEFKANAEYLTLPTGVDVRGVGNTYTVAGLTSATNIDYRYAAPAVVLFDANGQVQSTTFRVLQEGLLGQKLKTADLTPILRPTPDPGRPALGLNPYRANSGIGLVVYGTDLFKNGTAAFVANTQAGVNQIEDWLDQNATPSMVNRYNGTLVKGD